MHCCSLQGAHVILPSPCSGIQQDGPHFGMSTLLNAIGEQQALLEITLDIPPVEVQGYIPAFAFW